MQKLQRSRGLIGVILSLWVSVLLADSYTINFRNTDIQELIKFVSDATDTTMIIDPRVKGSVQVISSKSVDEKELYDLFLAILDTHGYAAARTGKVVTVVPKQQARSLPVPTQAPGENPSREMITSVIPLRHVPAAKMIAVLRPLVSQQGHMAAYPPSNAIIMSEVADNIQRLLNVIKRLDDASSDEINMIPLRFAAAHEVIRIINTLLKREASDKGRTLTMVADKRSNSILIAADEIERARIRQLIQAIDAPLAQAGNARVVYLQYAEAKQLAPVLGKLVQNLHAGGKDTEAVKISVEADEATNSLIITADPEVFKILEAVIAKLDIRRAQVLVEAIIVEVTDTDTRRLGIEWLLGDSESGLLTTSDPSAALGGIGAALPQLASGEGNSQTVGAVIASALFGVEGNAALIGGLNAKGDQGFAAILTALRRYNEANILSTPNLLTMDNTEATIVVGQNVPFRTGSYANTGSNNTVNPFQTIVRQDVGITLKVKPQINEGDLIMLEINQEVSDVIQESGGGIGAADLITNQRKIETTVLAQDREIIVLGGLIREDIDEVRRKVPLLGDIPLLGRMFRTSGTTINKTNLLIFMRSTIIRNAETMAQLTSKKYRYIREQQIKKQRRGVDFFSSDELPVLPAWEEQIKEMLKGRNLDALSDKVSVTPAAQKKLKKYQGDNAASKNQ